MCVYMWEWVCRERGRTHTHVYIYFYLPLQTQPTIPQRFLKAAFLIEIDIKALERLQERVHARELTHHRDHLGFFLQRTEFGCKFCCQIHSFFPAEDTSWSSHLWCVYGQLWRISKEESKGWMAFSAQRAHLSVCICVCLWENGRKWNDAHHHHHLLVTTYTYTHSCKTNLPQTPRHH